MSYHRLPAGLTLALALVAVTAAGCSDDDPANPRDSAARYELVGTFGSCAWAPGSDMEMDWEPPDGVEARGGGGSTNPRDAVPQETPVTGLDLQSAARIHTDDSGGIWVLTYGEAVHIVDGGTEQIYELWDGFAGASAIAVDQDGRLMAAGYSGIVAVEPGDDEYRVVTKESSSAIRPNGIACQRDGTLIAGGMFGDLFVVVTDDGQEHELLPRPEDDTPFVGISFVTVLTDGRIVVASSPRPGEDTMTLGVVDGRSLRPIGDGAGHPRSEASITSLAPAPDGRLLVTTADRTEIIDVDTGDSEVLVDLTGTAGTPSGAASGDDLVFLADGRLWRLPDAFVLMRT